MSIWWQENRVKQDLVEALIFLNRARTRESFVADERERLRIFYEMVLRFSRTYRRVVGKQGMSDEASVAELLFRALDEKTSRDFCDSLAVMRFTMIAPAIVEPSVSEPLTRASQNWMLNKALEHHKRFVEALAVSVMTAARKIFQEKSRKRRFFFKSNKRQMNIVRTLETVLLEVIEVLLGHPSRTLAVYGVLAPGEDHSHVLRHLRGSWSGGTVQGKIERERDYPVFTWIPSGRDMEVYLFQSEDLPAAWARIDRFEGEDYTRAWVIARFSDGEPVVSNIYHGRHKTPSR